MLGACGGDTDVGGCRVWGLGVFGKEGKKEMEVLTCLFDPAILLKT